MSSNCNMSVDSSNEWNYTFYDEYILSILFFLASFWEESRKKTSHIYPPGFLKIKFTDINPVLKVSLVLFKLLLEKFNCSMGTKNTGFHTVPGKHKTSFNYDASNLTHRLWARLKKTHNKGFVFFSSNKFLLREILSVYIFI